METIVQQIAPNCIGAFFGFVLAVAAETWFSKRKNAKAMGKLQSSLNKELAEIAKDISPFASEGKDYPYYLYYSYPIWEAACNSGMIQMLFGREEYESYVNAYGLIAFANRKEEEYRQARAEALLVQDSKDELAGLVSALDKARRESAKQVLQAIKKRGEMNGSRLT